MCRWIAYTGAPIFVEDLVTKPKNSLIAQSMEAKLNPSVTNGDGFGIGWYRNKKEPGMFKEALPAWNNQNLQEICAQTKAHTFFAHIRNSTNGEVQTSNSHPFKYKNWLFQHNGEVLNFLQIKRELHFEIEQHLYAEIKGTTDSETFFYLALTYGLEENPKLAFEKTIKRVERAQKDAGAEFGISLSCAASDGDAVYTVRYASGSGRLATQFYSNDMKSCISNAAGECSIMGDTGVIIVSEPLDIIGDKWIEVPENSFSIARNGKVSVQKLDV